jgi:peptide/nickel transport system substrate-binding protein
MFIQLQLTMLNVKKAFMLFLTVGVMLTAGFVFMVSSNSATGIYGNGANSSSSTNNSSGTFIFGTPVDTSVADLNPLTATNSLATILVGEMYATTLGFQWISGNFSSWLAQSWTVTNNANGTETIVFHLNPNADWVNGSRVVSEITSADVLFTFNVMKANSSLDTYDISPHILTMYANNLTTVTFMMKTQNVLWFQFLALQTIIPAAWAQYDSGNLSKIGGYTNMGPFGQEIEAGPFLLSTITSAGATMVPNTHFWMGTAKVKQFDVEAFTDTATADLALEKGTINAVNPALSDYNAMKNISSVVAIKQPENYVFYLWFNFHVAPFNNLHFRLGLAYALNKTRIMAKDEDGVGAAGSANMSFGGLPGVMKSAWAPNLTYYGYNVAAAESEFEQAGYHIGSNGFFVNNTTGKEVSFEIQEPSAVADWVASGTSIASELQAAHIDATVAVIPIGTWVTDDLNKTNFNQATYFGYVPSFVNPYVQLQEIYDYNGVWNYENFSNPQLNALFNSTANASSSTLSSALDPLQQIIDKVVPIIPMSNAYSLIAYSSNVKGFYTNLSADNPLNDMSIYFPSSSVTPPPSKPTTNNDIYYIIGGIVAAVVVIGGVAGYMVSSKKKNKGPGAQ